MCVYLQIEKLAIKALILFEKKTDNINIPVVLAVRICSSHPREPGSTPALGNLLNFLIDFFFH